MSSMLFTFFVLCLCGFAAMYLCLGQLVRQYEQTLQIKNFMSPLIYILLFYSIGTVGIYLSLSHNDFVEPLTLTRVILPIGLAGLIYLASIFSSEAIFNVILGGAMVALVLVQPIGQGSPIPLWPTWSIQLGAIVMGFIFCRFYKIMSSSVQAFIVPLLMILLGISILSALGAAPLFSALSAAVLIGILGAYLSINYYGIKIDLDEGACVVIAFLVYSLMLLQIGEFSFISCLTFSAVFWAELIAALWYKYVVTHAGNLMENSNYYIAATKYYFHAMTINVFKICAITLFLGWFQLFSMNSYSLPLVTLLLVLWLNHSFGRTDGNEPKKLRDINRAFIEDVKQNIKEAKDALNVSKKDD